MVVIFGETLVWRPLDLLDHALWPSHAQLFSQITPDTQARKHTHTSKHKHKHKRTHAQLKDSGCLLEIQQKLACLSCWSFCSWSQMRGLLSACTHSVILDSFFPSSDLFVCFFFVCLLLFFCFFVVCLFTRAPSFHLPSDSTVPVYMICSGTGIAPFRSFWQDRGCGASHDNHRWTWEDHRLERSFAISWHLDLFRSLWLGWRGVLQYTGIWVSSGV